MNATPLTEDFTPPTGKVEIADNAIVTVVHEAVMSCYGVVGLAPRSMGSNFARRFRRATSRTGVHIDMSEDHERIAAIDLSIAVEYGTPIFTVAQNVMQTVKFQVERLLGMPVERVNVNVDELRVSAPAERS